MSDGSRRKAREHLARLQRERRQRMTRIDYMPSRDALGVIDAKRAILGPGSVAATNSAVLDAIVCEWAELSGINNQLLQTPMTSERAPELSDTNARARMTSGACDSIVGVVKPEGTSVSASTWSEAICLTDEYSVQGPAVARPLT